MWVRFPSLIDRAVELACEGQCVAGSGLCESKGPRIRSLKPISSVPQRTNNAGGEEYCYSANRMVGGSIPPACRASVMPSSVAEHAEPERAGPDSNVPRQPIQRSCGDPTIPLENTSMPVVKSAVTSLTAGSEVRVLRHGARARCLAQWQSMRSPKGRYRLERSPATYPTAHAGCPACLAWAAVVKMPVTSARRPSTRLAGDGSNAESSKTP
jgi:hypothetical protein